MTTAQTSAMNTELWQNIGALADDDTLMRRLALYTRRLMKEKKADPTLMTKDEYFAMLDQRAAEYEQGKYHTYSSVEELDKYIRSL